jgi:pyruvate carboxylase
VSDAALYSHLMYPEVFADFAKFQGTYGNVDAVPTRSFLYGLASNEEISVDIEAGKTLFLKLIHVGEPDRDGLRTLTFELNGRPRETRVADKSIAAPARLRAKADPADILQVGAPIPGLITALAASVGAKVAKGDKLLTLEAMKMQTTLYASASGLIKEVFVAVGDTVESKDLLLKLQA